MTHIKLKFDNPWCLMCHRVEFNGEFCGRGCDCPAQKGKDICDYLRFQHIELETEVNEYEFRDNPAPEPGLTLYRKEIPIDLISYLEIDGRVLIDFEQERVKV